MTPFTTLTAPAIAMMADNVDTDQILPSRFLKTVQGRGLGDALFYNLRHGPAGDAVPSHPLNRLRASGLGILVSGANFGCGSSREHAPWALMDYGIRAVVAQSFADIFYNNSVNCGLLPAIVDRDALASLAALLGDDATVLTIDLAARVIRGEDVSVPFSIANEPRRRLALGVDPIAESLSDAAALADFEQSRGTTLPWLP